MPDGKTLAAEWEKILLRMLKWQKNFKVSGAQKFTNTEEGATISIGQPENTTTNVATDRWAVLYLLPGQLGIFGQGGGADLGGEQNPLPVGPGHSGETINVSPIYIQTGGYRASVIFPKAKPDFATGDPGDDPEPWDSESDYQYNAVYYNLDEMGDSFVLLNPLDPDGETHSSGKWLTDNENSGDEGDGSNATYPSSLTPGQPYVMVLGFKIGVNTDGRAIYIGVGGRANQATRPLDGSPTGAYWIRGGANKGEAPDQDGVGAAGVSVILTDSTTGYRTELKFDSSGKLFSAQLLSSDSGDAAYTSNNPPP